MSYADKVFDENIRTILSSGYSTVNDKVRPHWADDGSPTYTYKAFGIINRYDLSKSSRLLLSDTSISKGTRRNLVDMAEKVQ